MDLFKWQPDAKTAKPDANLTLRRVAHGQPPDAPDAPGNPTQSRVYLTQVGGRREVSGSASPTGQSTQTSKFRDAREVTQERELLRQQLPEPPRLNRRQRRETFAAWTAAGKPWPPPAGLTSSCITPLLRKRQEQW